MALKQGVSFLSRCLSDLVFPPVCSLCGSPLEDSQSAFCNACSFSIKRLSGRICNRCGRPYGGLAHANLRKCGECLSSERPFEMARFAALYTGELRKAVIRFKFYGALHLAGPLSTILMETFFRYYRHMQFDAIVPVPIHPRRLLARGFNQVVVLAEKLSAHTGIPVDRTSFCKVIDTPPQVGLSRTERTNNLKQSLKVCRPDRIRGKSVLLLDDVATSGATINESARRLKRSGASRICALVLALRWDTLEDVHEADRPLLS